MYNICTGIGPWPGRVVWKRQVPAYRSDVKARKEEVNNLQSSLDLLRYEKKKKNFKQTEKTTLTIDFGIFRVTKESLGNTGFELLNACFLNFMIILVFSI